MGIVPLKVTSEARTASYTTPNTFDMRACPCPLLYIAVIFSTQDTYSVVLPLIAAVAESLISASSFMTPLTGAMGFMSITKAVGTLSSAAAWHTRTRRA